MTHTPPQHATHKIIAYNISNGTRFFQSIIFVLVTALMLIVAVPAQAQDTCDTIGENPEWSEGMSKLITSMQEGDLQAAKSHAKVLSEICPNAPAFNYLQGKLAESLGETKEALYYYQKSSENTYTFAVAPDTAKKIWYARYENEYPDRTAKALSLKNARLDALEAQTAQQQADTQKTYNTLMWTGAGVGIGGLALTIAGITLVAFNTSVHIDKTEDDQTLIHEKPYHSLGWTFVGSGVVMMLTGSALAGVFGYKLHHTDAQRDAITFHISPMNFSIGMMF